jgi:glycosyltransferase involved in cell wall biosynthesis
MSNPFTAQESQPSDRAPNAAPRITCCVFAWDEIATLRAVVEEHLATLGGLGATYELLIIDDGSTDGTSQEADRLALEWPGIVRVIHHGENLGLGGVYRTGFTRARGEYVTFFPADGQFPSTIHERFYPLIESWDMVLGNLPGRNDKLIGSILGWIERLLYRTAFGHMPRLEGVFIFRRDMLGRIDLKSVGRGWTVVWELVLRAHRGGYRIVGCPIVLLPRRHGESKVNNLRSIAANLRQLIALRRLLDS